MYNLAGVCVKSGVMTGGKAEISTAGMTEGLYIISVDESRGKIVIRH